MASRYNQHVLVSSVVSTCCYLGGGGEGGCEDPQAETQVHRLIEVNIAIIVGCMPAFAQIVSSHVIGSSFFRSLRTRLLGSSDGRGSSRSKSGSNKQAQGLVTFGARQTPRRVDPYEMTDTTLLNTKATAVDDDPRETGSRSEAQSTRTSEAEQATEQRIRSEET